MWREAPRVVVKLLPLSRFLKLFYRIAYEDRALVVGFNLPFDLARLAADWHEVKKGRNVGGWHLDLWTFRDRATGEERPSAGWRPGVILKRKAPDVVFIEFTGLRADGERAKGSRYRGEFLDLSNLAHALTGRHWTLAEALAAFTCEGVDRDVEHGRITPDYVDYCRSDVRATVSLAKTLLGLLDRLHPVSRGAGERLSETHLYSPGGPARAHLAAAGFSPPGVPKDRLGPCAAAFFGGWAEVQLRGPGAGGARRFPAPVPDRVRSPRASGSPRRGAARLRSKTRRSSGPLSRASRRTICCARRRGRCLWRFAGSSPPATCCRSARHSVAPPARTGSASRWRHATATNPFRSTSST